MTTFKTNIIVGLLFLFLTLVVTFPLILHLNSFVVDRGDGLLITWIINWNIFHPLNFDTNIFYPIKNTLAFSDLLYLQSIIAAPFVLIFKDPLLVFNINLIVGFVMTGFSLYLLINYLTKNRPASFLAGTIFTFSPLHFDFLVHQQLFHIWPVILAWYYILKNDLKKYILCFVLSSWSTALFVHFLILISIFYKKIKWLIWAMLFAAPFMIPYFLVSLQWHYVRPITDAIHYSLQVPDLFNPGNFSRFGQIPNPFSQFSSHYFGLPLLFLLLLNLKKVTLKNKFILIAIISFVLSLGPALHVFKNTIHIGPIPAIPLPYAVFYYLIPGFSGFRTPSRWILMAVLALTIFLFTTFAKKINKKIILGLFIICFAELNIPLKFKTLPNVPEHITWLKNNYIDEPLIYFPIYNWDDLNTKNWEAERMYYSTFHWHPMFNGYSGFTPQERQEQIKWLQKEFPSQTTINFLKNMGIKLVLTSDEIPGMNLVKRLPELNVYKL